MIVMLVGCSLSRHELLDIHQGRNLCQNYQDTMRWRLDFAVDEDCMAVNRLPFVVMDVFQEDEEIEIRQLEKN